jgi:hypothetical protein
MRATASVMTKMLSMPSTSSSPTKRARVAHAPGVCTQPADQSTTAATFKESAAEPKTEKPKKTIKNVEVNLTIRKDYQQAAAKMKVFSARSEIHLQMRLALNTFTKVYRFFGLNSLVKAGGSMEVLFQ